MWCILRSENKYPRFVIPEPSLWCPGCYFGFFFGSYRLSKKGKTFLITYVDELGKKVKLRIAKIFSYITTNFTTGCLVVIISIFLYLKTPMSISLCHYL